MTLEVVSLQPNHAATAMEAGLSLARPSPGQLFASCLAEVLSMVMPQPDGRAESQISAKRAIRETEAQERETVRQPKREEVSPHDELATSLSWRGEAEIKSAGKDDLSRDKDLSGKETLSRVSNEKPQDRTGFENQKGGGKDGQDASLLKAEKSGEPAKDAAPAKPGVTFQGNMKNELLNTNAQPNTLPVQAGGVIAEAGKVIQAPALLQGQSISFDPQAVSGTTFEAHVQAAVANFKQAVASQTSSGTDAVLKPLNGGGSVKVVNPVHDASGRGESIVIKGSTQASIDKLISTKQTPGENQRIMIENIMRFVKSSGPKETGEIRMTLTPEKLGTLKVNLKVEENSVTISCKVENQTAKILLLSGLETLKDSLAEEGMTLADFNVLVGDDHRESANPEGRGDDAKKDGSAAYFGSLEDASEIEGHSIGMQEQATVDITV